MPNHITNYVEIRGSADKVADLVKRTVHESDNNMTFDFNGIIPMPHELKETACPTQIFETQKEADECNTEYAKSVMGQTGEPIRAITRAEADRRAAAYGNSTFRFSKEHPGILNWYDWANFYWGTKWGAYSVEILKQESGRIVMSFQTAWSPPEAIFDKLVADGFEVNCYWYDEDPSNYGEYGNPHNTFDHFVDHSVNFNG